MATNKKRLPSNARSRPNWRNTNCSSIQIHSSIISYYSWLPGILVAATPLMIFRRCCCGAMRHFRLLLGRPLFPRFYFNSMQKVKSNSRQQHHAPARQDLQSQNNLCRPGPILYLVSRPRFPCTKREFNNAYVGHNTSADMVMETHFLTRHESKRELAKIKGP